MKNFTKKIALLLIIGVSILQLSMTFLMDSHSSSTDSCSMSKECVVATYNKGNDAVFLTYLLFTGLMLAISSRFYPQIFKEAFAYTKTNFREQKRFLRGVIQRE